MFLDFVGSKCWHFLFDVGSLSLKRQKNERRDCESRACLEVEEEERFELQRSSEWKTKKEKKEVVEKRGEGKFEGAVERSRGR